MFKLSDIIKRQATGMLCPGSRLMGGHMRAVDETEKQARRDAILNAADRLFAERHDLANVADIAAAAGLAKGTVYLYFQTKEEIYLSLHQRHNSQFFEPLLARLADDKPFTFDEMMVMTVGPIMQAPSYLPLGARCAGFANGSVPEAALQVFKATMTHWLESAGAGLESNFHKLPAGEGTRLLKHSYALMIGLHALSHGDMAGNNCVQLKGIGTFQEEATLAITRYWTQVAGIQSSPLDNHSIAPVQGHH